MLTKATIIGAMLLLTAAHATAQVKPGSVQPLIDDLDRCRPLTDPALRLACLDRTAAALVGAARSGQLVVVDRGQMRQARRSLFGFTMPQLPFFAGDRSSDDQPTELQATVKTVRATSDGRFVVRLTEGDALWETTEALSSMGTPKAGQKLVIKKGALGSFLLRFQGERWVRARRVG